jgi:hypothetical protein
MGSINLAGLRVRRLGFHEFSCMAFPYPSDSGTNKVQLYFADILQIN